ncbi:MAG: hypothetical protein AcusKO_46940 [Acuticoccus sp.]
MPTIDFNSPSVIDFTNIDLSRSGAPVFTSSISYDFLTPANRVTVEGTNFIHSGGDITAGTIQNIGIDLGNDSAANVITDDEIQITGLNITSNADLTSIDNGEFSLFGTALQGDDFFDLSDLDEDGITPTGTNRIFGDDLSNIFLSLVGATNNNNGGDDTFDGVDNNVELAGDVWSLVGQTGTFGFNVTYNGGNDTFFTIDTEQFARVAGDAWEMDRPGVANITLNGGDDTIDISGNTSGSSWAAGDINILNNGTVNGGDDTIQGDASFSPQIAGDVRTYNGGTVNGGNDVISAEEAGDIGGDVYTLNAPVPAGVFTITGGDDEIMGGYGVDDIAGDVYNRVSTTDNVIVGGDDVIIGGAGDDNLFGEVRFGSLTNVSGGNDVMLGGDGNDELRGQTGDDYLDGGNDNDTIDGGAGNDTVSYLTAGAGVSVNLALSLQNTIGAGTDSLLGLENLEGSRYGDTLQGNGGDNAIDGRLGNDLLFSGPGNDTIDGGLGNDTLDTFGETDDVALGGGGNDRFETDGGGNILSGGAGRNTVSFAGTSSDAVIELNKGEARLDGGTANDILTDMQDAVGGSGDDTIKGDDIGNDIDGNGGDDSIVGNDGNDTIDGGGGADIVRGQSDEDVLNGGGNNDTVRGGSSSDTVSGGGGDDTVLGDGGGDIVNGDAGFDLLRGGTGSDVINGGGDDDTLRGESGADELNGDGGDDNLFGDENNDTLFGGAGEDRYEGGDGADILVFAPTAGVVQDRIINFEDTGAISDDIIDVTAYGFASVASITASASGDDAILDFGGGDTVRIVDYLLTNTLGDIGSDDFIL